MNRRGRPAKAKPNTGDEVKKVPGKRGRPAGSTNAPKPTTLSTTESRSGRSIKPVVTLASESTSKPVAESATGKKRGRPPANAASKPRGRPPKVATATEPKTGDEPAKRRGRPPKGSVPVAKPKVEAATKTSSTSTGKKRGRPAKSESTTATPTTKPRTVPSSGKKRGRPAKSAEEKAASAPADKKRGRPAKSEDATTPATAGKKRGRPAKTEEPTSSTSPAKKRGRPAEEDGTKVTATAGKKRGRPAKSETTAPPAKKAKSSPSAEREPGTKRYWLMKAEPLSRIETAPSGKQVDVKFSIDDLAAKTEPELWDGIRNHQAHANILAMRPGDLAFLSESNINPPGLVGIMEVVGPAVADPSQFNEDSPYFDAKATEEQPRWHAVPVVLKRRFDEKVVAPGAGRNAKGYEDVSFFKGSRLSVRAVPEDEWEIIMGIVDAREGKTDDEDTGKVAAEAMGLLERIGAGVKRAFTGEPDAEDSPEQEQGEEAPEDVAEEAKSDDVAMDDD